VAGGKRGRAFRWRGRKRGEDEERARRAEREREASGALVASWGKDEGGQQYKGRKNGGGGGGVPCLRDQLDLRRWWGKGGVERQRGRRDSISMAQRSERKLVC